MNDRRYEVFFVLYVDEFEEKINFLRTISNLIDRSLSFIYSWKNLLIKTKIE